MGNTYLLINTCLTRFSNCFRASSSTLKNACAVRSLVCSFCRFHTPSLFAKTSPVVRTRGMIRTSNPHMLNSRLGLSLEYTLTNPLFHSREVSDRGRRFFMSQNTARPRFTSCFIKRIRESRGQHFLLLYPTRFSLFGSGCSVRYRWIRSLLSSFVNLNKMCSLSMYREYSRIGCRVSVATSLIVKKKCQSCIAMYGQTVRGKTSLLVRVHRVYWTMYGQQSP